MTDKEKRLEEWKEQLRACEAASRDKEKSFVEMWNDMDDSFAPVIGHRERPEDLWKKMVKCMKEMTCQECVGKVKVYQGQMKDGKVVVTLNDEFWRGMSHDSY